MPSILVTRYSRIGLGSRDSQLNVTELIAAAVSRYYSQQIVGTKMMIITLPNLF